MVTGAPEMLNNAKDGVPYAEIFARTDPRLKDYFKVKEGAAVTSRFGKTQYHSDFAAKLFSTFLEMIMLKSIREGKVVKPLRTGKVRLALTSEYYIERFLQPLQQPPRELQKRTAFLLILGDLTQSLYSKLRPVYPFQTIKDEVENLKRSTSGLKVHNLTTISTAPYITVDDVLDDIMSLYPFLYKPKIRSFLYWGFGELIKVSRGRINVALGRRNDKTGVAELFEIVYAKGSHTGAMKNRRTKRFKRLYPKAYRKLLKKNTQRALQHVRDNNLTELPMKYKLFLENETATADNQ